MIAMRGMRTILYVQCDPATDANCTVVCSDFVMTSEAELAQVPAAPILKVPSDLI